VELAGIDICLVGDSAAMVVHGHDTTLPITLEEMLVHCRNGLPYALSPAGMLSFKPFTLTPLESSHLVPQTSDIYIFYLART